MPHPGQWQGRDDSSDFPKLTQHLPHLPVPPTPPGSGLCPTSVPPQCPSGLSCTEEAPAGIGGKDRNCLLKKDPSLSTNPIQTAYQHEQTILVVICSPNLPTPFPASHLSSP